MKKGFTLVEILVVLVIIGILIALLLPNMLKAISQANDKECASNLRTIDTAVRMCYAETRNWGACDTIVKLIAVGSVGAYLEATPICPFGDDYNTFVIDAVTGAVTSNKTATHFNQWPPTAPHQ